MEKILDIITAVICILIAALIFLTNVLQYLNMVVRFVFLILSCILLAMAPYKGSGAFGFTYNPIARPLFLIIVCAFSFPDFDNFCPGYWTICLANIVSAIGFFYGIVLLVIYIVLMAMKKVDYKRT